MYTGLKRPMGFLVLQAFGLRLGFEAWRRLGFILYKAPWTHDFLAKKKTRTMTAIVRALLHCLHALLPGAMLSFSFDYAGHGLRLPGLLS